MKTFCKIVKFSLFHTTFEYCSSKSVHSPGCTAMPLSIIRTTSPGWCKDIYTKHITIQDFLLI